ncbi:MAG: M48 family metalloprotease [Cyclobacteriaceae bacterium]|nr:M48 family metalloprotease [Cyclobacteriaceae bacterium]
MVVLPGDANKVNRVTSSFRLWVLAASITILPLAAQAQFDKDYTPAAFLDTIPADLLQTLTKRAEAEKSSLSLERGKVEGYASELLDDRLKFLVDYFNKDYFILESDLTIYMDKVLQRIQAANPELPDSLMVLPFRSASVNAVNFGNGVIAFMLGLMARMENEDQVAFVICHELAHSYARHGEKKIVAYAKLNYDKDLKKRVNEAKRSTYLQYSQLMKIMKELHFSMNRHSRENELEADSLALVFYLRAGYRPEGSLETMDILNRADSDLYASPPDLRKRFQSSRYPFKESWLTYTPPTAWIRRSMDPELDTSRTHPDCPLRKDALRRQLGSAAKPETPAPAPWVFGPQAQFEVVESSFHFKKYGYALYASLQLIERYPRNGYLHAMIIKCLFYIYLSQKNHELGKVVELPDSRFSDSYNRFLSFIHQLRLSELSALSYHYAISQDEQTFTNEHFLYALWLSSQLPVSELDPLTIHEDYVSRYPKGRYQGLMKKPLTPKP